MVRVVVCGEQHWECHDLARRVIARLKLRYGDVTIVHGACRGVDATFAYEAVLADCTACVFPSDSTTMIAAGVDFVVAIHRDLTASKRTRGLVALALNRGIPVHLIDNEDGEPQQLQVLPGGDPLDRLLGPHERTTPDGRIVLAWSDPTVPALDLFDDAVPLPLPADSPQPVRGVANTSERPTQTVRKPDNHDQATLGLSGTAIEPSEPEKPKAMTTGNVIHIDPTTMTVKTTPGEVIKAVKPTKRTKQADRQKTEGDGPNLF